MKQYSTTFIQPCPQWIEKLHTLHPDDLSPQERAQLSKHLETCARCQAVKAEYATIDSLLLSLPRAKPLTDLPTPLEDVIGGSKVTRQSLTDDKTEDGILLQPLQLLTSHTLTIQRRTSHLAGKLNLIAAVLVVTVLLGGFLLLFNTHHPGSVNTGNTLSGLPNFTRLYLVTTGADGQMNKVLSARDPSNGHVTWQRKLDNVLDGNGLSMQDKLYFPALDGNVYAFRGRDGQPLWHTSIGHGPVGFISVTLLAYQNLIIASITNTRNDNGDLYALNAQTGTVVWHLSLLCAVSSSNDCAAGGRLTYLANGIIYGLADDGLSAWNATNGHFLWRNPRYQLNGQPQSMVVSHGKIYITNFYPKVDVLNSSSGNFLHSLRPPEPNNSGAVIYDITANQDTVYILGGQTVSAYQASDDSLLWKQPFSYHSGGYIYAGRNGIYVNYYSIVMGGIIGTGGGSGNNLYALRSSDGQQIWHGQAPSGAHVEEAEFNDVICFSGLNNVYGIRVSDGKQLWQLPVGGYVDSLFAG